MTARHNGRVYNLYVLCDDCVPILAAFMTLAS